MLRGLRRGFQGRKPALAAIDCCVAMPVPRRSTSTSLPFYLLPLPQLAGLSASHAWRPQPARRTAIGHDASCGARSHSHPPATTLPCARPAGDQRSAQRVVWGGILVVGQSMHVPLHCRCLASAASVLIPQPRARLRVHTLCTHPP